MWSDIRLEIFVPVLVYRPHFGPIETTLKNGPTGNPPLPVNRSEIQKTKSTARCGIKFSICEYIFLWGFKIPESCHLCVAPKKTTKRRVFIIWMTDSPETFLKTDLLRKFLQFDKNKGLAIKGFSEETGQKSKKKTFERIIGNYFKFNFWTSWSKFYLGFC